MAMAMFRTSEKKKPSLWSLGGGIYFGCDRHRNPQYFAGDGHIVTLGPNGSGKSKRLGVPQLAHAASSGWSCVVCDVNGELSPMLQPHFEALGYKVLKLAPFGEDSNGYNPVRSMAINDELPDNCLGHGEAVVRAMANTHQPHFPFGGQDIWAGIEMYVRLVIPNGSLGDTRMFLSRSTDDIQKLIKDSIIEYEGQKYPGILQAAEIYGWPEMAAKVNRYSSISPNNNELLGIISTALVESRSLDSRKIRKDLKGPQFDFQVMKEKKTVVFLVLPPKHLEKHATWFRIIITSIVQALMEEVGAKIPTFFYLDEFFAIAEGGFPIITKKFQMFRKYGIKCEFVFQDIPQMKALLGDTTFETFIANAGLVQSFAPNEYTTAEWLSQRAGQKTAYVKGGNLGRSINANQLPGSSDSLGLTQVAVPRMRPQEFIDMEEDETIVFSRQLPEGHAIVNVPFPTEFPHLRDIMSRDLSQ